VDAWRISSKSGDLLFFSALRGYFVPLVEVFKDHSDQGRHTQVLLNDLILKNMPDSAKYTQLDALRRQIRQVSVFKDKNLLLAAYSALVSKTSRTACKFKDDFCEDIVNGLTEDQEFWIAVLNGFFACRNPPRSRLAYDSFYGPVRRLFESIELDATNKDCYVAMALAFSKIVELRNSATSEEWMLLLRSEFFRVHPDIFIHLIKEISPVNLPEERRAYLVISSLSTAPFQPRTVVSLIRLMETSINPLELGRLISEHFETFTENRLTAQSNIPSCTWNLLVVVCENAPAAGVYEILLKVLLHALKLRENSQARIVTNAAAMYKMFTMIIESNLCCSDSCKPIFLSIAAQIEIILKNKSPDTLEFFYLYSILRKINATNEIRASLSMRQELLIQRHRISPPSVTVKEFSDYLERLLRSLEYNQGDKLANARNSLMLIEFIQEFHSESYYFDVTRSSQFDSKIKKHRYEAFYPRLMLLEAMKFLNDNQPILDSVKKILSYDDCSYSWYGKSNLCDDQSIERYLLLRNEQQYIAEEAAKIFSRTIDAYAVKFFAKLYFLILNHEAVTDIYAAPVFAQLARL
jgi:hypothetical protein